MSHVTRLHRLYNRIEAILEAAGESEADPLLDRRTPSVSGWSVREQLDHTLKVASSIAATLLQRAEIDGPPLSVVGRIILLTGRIPRGRGRSPQSLLPEPAHRATLIAALGRAREQLDELAQEPHYLRSSKRIVRHPLFGVLTPAQALRFAAVHTAHHLRIIDDITRGGFPSS